MARHVEKVERLGGFAAENIPNGEEGAVIDHAFLDSGTTMFGTIMSQFINVFCQDIHPESINMLLVLVHHDDSADIYFNDEIVISMEASPKQPIKSGEPVCHSSILDIRRIKFLNADIKETDQIIFCFRSGWQFGLAFDLRPNQSTQINVYNTELWLGWAYKIMLFQDELATINCSAEDPMIKDGWFPFIELTGGKYKHLHRLYHGGRLSKEMVEEWVDKNFNSDRVTHISEKWWNKRAFFEIREMLTAGIEQYNFGTKAALIGSIKVLYSELEGILRKHYGYTKKTKSYELIRALKNDGLSKFDTQNSLAFPEKFSDYLKTIIFANFDPDTPITLSRNSALHGVAPSETYTRFRALQIILTLDQIYFFLPHDPK